MVPDPLVSTICNHLFGVITICDKFFGLVAICDRFVKVVAICDFHFSSTLFSDIFPLFLLLLFIVS